MGPRGRARCLADAGVVVTVSVAERAARRPPQRARGGMWLDFSGRIGPPRRGPPPPAWDLTPYSGGRMPPAPEAWVPSTDNGPVPSSAPWGLSSMEEEGWALPNSPLLDGGEWRAGGIPPSPRDLGSFLQGSSLRVASGPSQFCTEGAWGPMADSHPPFWQGQGTSCSRGDGRPQPRPPRAQEGHSEKSCCCTGWGGAGSLGSGFDAPRHLAGRRLCPPGATPRHRGGREGHAGEEALVPTSCQGS